MVKIQTDIKFRSIHCTADGFKQLKKQLDICQIELGMIKKDIRGQTELSNSLDKLGQCIEKTREYGNSCYVYRNTLFQICQIYEENEKRLANSNITIPKWMEQPFPPYHGVMLSHESSNGMLQFMETFINNKIGDTDILSLIKTWLNFSDIKESGVIKKSVSYFEAFTKFFNGDKKGLTGARDLCDLANSSISLWSGLYDYFAGTYEGLKKLDSGLFGKNAQRKVKELGMSGSILGLISSIMSANNDMDQKTLQEIIADYVKCGKNGVSIYNAKYAIDHIGDTKSLISQKAGGWSALDIYSAIANGGVDVASQAIKSYGKYYADGKWSLEDTAAMCVDVSVAGLYGMAHALSFGLDEVIYGAIDDCMGKKGDPNLSYAEQAAEGIKQISKSWGEQLGNTILEIWNKKN